MDQLTTNVYDVTWTYLDWFLDNHDSIQDVDGLSIERKGERESSTTHSSNARSDGWNERKKETRGPFHSLHQNFLHQISAPPLLCLSLSSDFILSLSFSLFSVFLLLVSISL